MPVFGLAAVWREGASPEGVASVVEGLGTLLPSAQSLQLVVALREEEAALELKVDVPGYPRAAVDLLAREVERSGGTFVELWRLPKAERDALRARTLGGGTSFRGEERGGAARALQEHLAALAQRGPRAKAPAVETRPLTAPLPAPVKAAAAVEPTRVPEATPERPQRRGRRFAVKLELEFRTELDFVREHALNISNGGLFVRTAHRPPPDSLVTVDVRLPDGKRLQGDALVVHVVDDPYTGGVGLAFLNDDVTFARTLDDYLASLVGGAG